MKMKIYDTSWHEVYRVEGDKIYDTSWHEVYRIDDIQL